MIVELTDDAIVKLLEKKKQEQFNYIRLGITGGGFGELKFVINKLSVPYINGMTLDFRKEGLNEVFKFLNPKEKSSCGCGVSINFDLEQVEVDRSKIFAVEL